MDPFIKPSQDKENQKTLNAGIDFRLLFDQTGTGVIIYKANGQCIDYNQEAISIFGLDQTDNNEILLFFNCKLELFDKNLNKVDFQKEIVSKVLNNRPFKDERYIALGYGTKNQVFIKMGGYAQRGANGNVQYGVVTLRNISSEANVKHGFHNEVDKNIFQQIQIEHYQKELEKEKILLHTIIHSIPVMVVIYNELVDNIIINKAFEDITGWNMHDVKEKSIMDLAYPEPERRAEVIEFMQSLKPGFKDIVMRTKDGRDIETSWANVKIPDGRQVGVGINITERKNAEYALIRAKEKAIIDKQNQASFVQNISHEVRTPMNAILGFTELLNKWVVDKKGKEYLDAIEFNGNQLLRLIDDILDISRIDKNELSLVWKEVHIEEVLKKVQKCFPGLINKHKKYQLNTLLTTPQVSYGHVYLKTDIQRLMQVFTNLLSNAIKYTLLGSVEVGFDMDDAQKNITFYVKDTGMGIKNEDHAKVFKRFNRFHQSGEANNNGTGLGLSICAKLVQLLGGRIWFESEYGKGSVFYFTHPYIEDHQYQKPCMAKTEEDTENDSLPRLLGKTILVAEDDEFSFLMLEGMLMETRAHIIHAKNGSKALEIIDTRNLDMAFLDIRLPGLDGYGILEHIKKKGKKIPVVALTANAQPEDFDRSLKAGFDHHATKPISQSKLFTILNKFLT
jgi:PAS domain S-box-containing protein